MRYIAILLMLACATAWAGGDAGEPVPDSLLSPPQMLDNTHGVMTPQSWLDRTEQRAVELSALKHRQKVLAYQVQLAKLRSECQIAGIHCDVFQPRLSPTEPQMRFAPTVIGVDGERVLLRIGDQAQSVMLGQTWRRHHVVEVGLDHVVFKSPTGALNRYSISPGGETP